MTRYEPPAAARARAKAALLENDFREPGSTEHVSHPDAPEQPNPQPAPAEEPRPQPVRKAPKANRLAGIGRLIAAIFGAAKRIKLPKRPQRAPKEDPQVIDGEVKEPGGSKILNIVKSKRVKVVGIVVAAVALLIVAVFLIGNLSGPPASANLQVPDFTSPTGDVMPLDQTTTGLPSVQAQAPKPLTVRTTAVNLGLDFEVPLLSLAFVAMFIFSLLESQAQGDYILLDFFSAWGMVAILVLGQIYGHEQGLFYAFLGAGVFAILIATVWNPSEENEAKWFNKIDTTHIYVLGLALLFLHFMNSPKVPYPEYVPIIIPAILVAVGMGKEVFRQVGFSIFAIAIGLVPALLQTGIAISIGFAAEVLLAAFGSHQGWITTRGTQATANIGGRKFQLFIAWDIVLFYVAEVALLGYALYGNYAVWTITR